MTMQLLENDSGSEWFPYKISEFQETELMDHSHNPLCRNLNFTALSDIQDIRIILKTKVFKSKWHYPSVVSPNPLVVMMYTSIVTMYSIRETQQYIKTISHQLKDSQMSAFGDWYMVSSDIWVYLFVSYAKLKVSQLDESGSQ